MRYLYIAVGGAVGALARWGLGGLWPHAALPAGILLVNLSGSLLLGCLFPLTLASTMSPEVRLGIVTGFFGAYTTFSTWMAGTWALGAAHLGLAALYLGLTLVGGITLSLAGTAAARWMIKRAEGGAAGAG